MFKQYVFSQQRDMLRLSLVTFFISGILYFIFIKNVMFTLIFAFMTGALLTLLYLCLTYFILKKGMMKNRVDYSVTKTGKLSGNSRIYYCKLEGSKLVSTNYLFPLELSVNASIQKSLNTKGYFYKKEGMTNYFIFKGRWENNEKSRR